MKIFKKFKRKQMLFLLSTLLLMGACGRVRFELDKFAQVPFSIVTEIENAKIKCAEAEAKGLMLEKTQDIFFPTVPECRWEEDGNYSKINRLIRARQEQYIDIDIPKDAILCDMDFDFPTQTMKYDDEIFLTLGGKVLFASQDYSVTSGEAKFDEGLMVNSLGLIEYKWDGDNGIANLFYDWAVTPRYCLGVDPADMDTKCVIPATERTGQFSLEIDKEKIIQIGQLNGLVFDEEDESILNTLEPLKIGFITTGDNDRYDCEHTDFDFDVKIKYIIQPTE